MSFTLTLPSNSSMDLFPENRQSEYTVHLSEPIDLKTRYEVGLAEVHFPSRWRNIVSVNNEFKLRTYDIKPPSEKEALVSIELLEGLRIDQAVNHAIPPAFKKSFNMQLTKVEGASPEMHFAEILLAPGYEVFLPHALARFLKFNTDPNGLINTSTRGIQPLTKFELDQTRHLLEEAYREYYRNRQSADVVDSPPRARNPGGSPERGGHRKRAESRSPSPPARANRAGSRSPSPPPPARVNTTFGDLKTFGFYIKIRRTPDYGQIRESLKLDEGFYSTVEEILGNMLKKIEDALHAAKIGLTSKPELKLLPDLRIKFTYPPNIRIKFPRNNGLGALLGVEDASLNEWLSSPHETKYPAELTGGMTGVYIYTDLIKAQHVGHLKTPLLRVIPVETDTGKKGLLLKRLKIPTITN